MADQGPTKFGFFRACHLCLLGVFAPKRLTKEQEMDNARLKQTGETKPKAMILCSAFWWSLFLVVSSSAVGFAAGKLTGSIVGPVSPGFVSGLQAMGAMLLLWGTLFVRGWDIQSIGGETLVEYVNHWIYRALYCLGTADFVFSLSLP
jgi:hypothetical protein